jgi:hypothetical protein
VIKVTKQSEGGDVKMAELSLVLGVTGGGKSYSLRNLPSESTFLIQTTPKMLPFKGGGKKYVKLTKENPKGNLFVSDKSSTILKALSSVNERKEIKYVFLDDMQYTIINSYLKRIREKLNGGDAFQKYNDLAADYNDIMNYIVHEMRDDIIVFVASHVDTDDFGNTTIKTVGKLINDKIKIEGMSSLVLLTDLIDGEYVFRVNGEGIQKTPFGMFEENSIPNDLKLVIDAVEKWKKED